ncbi:hypothetical protein [Cellulosilyticum sp. I15G10I2]|uniref:hypothetical protein n=1 Tax=Cellulosilyticum sp. I15G10I2 TaxID=1892843 RepID=UPI0014957323|nr:hypothetical protein [Cellulosilyticum sp. I15G10I2]
MIKIFMYYNLQIKAIETEAKKIYTIKVSIYHHLGVEDKYGDEGVNDYAKKN